MAKFPFGSNEPFYSDREPVSEQKNNALGVAGLLGVGTGLFATGFIPQGQGNMFDNYYKGLRTLGHMSPYGILSSLRIPEFISPFTSERFKSGGAGPVVFDRNFLHSPDTLNWLSKVTGRSVADLSSIGVGSGASLRYERASGFSGLMGRGRLVAFAPGMTDFVLSEDISLMERTHAPGDIFSPRANVNPAAEALGSVVDESINMDNTFKFVDPVTGEVRGAHQFVPFQSVMGKIDSWKSFVDRFTLPRAYAAFEAQRVIKATETLSENMPIIGETFLKPIINKFNLPKGGTATKTYLRLGGFAAKIGAAATLVSEYNWFMRYQGENNILNRELGYTASSGVIGFTAGWLGRSVRGATPKLAQLKSINTKHFAIAGIASFIGQNILPGFEKGVTAGVSQTVTNLGIVKSSIGQVTGMNAYRQKLEEVFPGISSTATGLFVAGAHYAVIQSLIPGQTRWGRFFSHLQHDTGTTSRWQATKAGWRSPNRVYEAWEKVSYNLRVGEDLNAYKANVASGSAHKPTMPYQLENEEFAERMMSHSEYRTAKGLSATTAIPAHVGSNVSLPKGRQYEEIAKHLFSNIDAKYAGKLTGKLSFSAGAVAAIGGFLMHHVLTTGIVGSTQDPEQLKRISSGEEWVPVRKSRWWGCLNKNTIIITSTNAKKISEVKVGDRVLTKEGVYKRVLNVFKNNRDDRKLFKVKAKGSTIPIELTGNHIIFIKRNSEYLEIPIEDLKLTDKLIFPIRNDINYHKLQYLNFSNYILKNHLSLNGELFSLCDSYNRFRKSITSKPLKSSSKVNYNLGLFFGLYLGDGCLLTNSSGVGGIEFYFGPNEKDIANYCSESGFEIFGVKPTIHNVKSTIRVRFCNVLLGEFFNGFFGVDKNIPECLDNCSDEFYKGLYDGLYLSDGTRHHGEEIITAININHLIFLRDKLLNKFNIWGTLSIKSMNLNSNRQVSYSLSYRADKRNKTGISIDKTNKFVLLDVKNIEVSNYDDEFVYDLEIEDVHSYCTVSFSVHNSGGTPWEGNKISHYRPSLNAIIQADVESKSVWGEEAEDIDPVSRFFLKNFSYYLEEKNYYNRPYPISSPAFSDIPVLGDILGSTIGSIIKPPKIMHADEWININGQGEASYLTVPGKLDSNAYLGMGGTGVGTPISPHSLGFALSQTQYKFRELQGLSGFVKNTLQEMATGSETFMPTSPVLATSNMMTSASDRYWDLELGGMAGSTEIIRRFLPKDRLQTRNRYNPIYNQMPSWIPEEFRRGDPYATLQMGSARLPGPGFEALYPELKGINPEEYPLWAKYQILASVSPYSEEFRSVQNQMYELRSKGIVPERVSEMVDRIDSQLNEQRFRRNYWRPGPENEDDNFAEKVARNSYFALIDNMKRLVAPVEYLSPFRPFQKFLPSTTAIADYENYYIYGAETAMWKPQAAIREFIGPSVIAAARIMGYKGIPPDVVEKRQIDEYFDKLNYYKYMSLALEAKKEGKGRLAYQYQKYAHKTVHGVNPFGNTLSIYASLPEAEKSHFDAFANATSSQERARIIELVPENQKKIFAALWARKDGTINKKIERLEGMSDTYYSEYISSGESKYLSYPDFARMKELEEYFSAQPPPREDWVGYNSHVDLNDVKLNYVKQEGWNIHDFNMWESQEQLIARKPYVEGAEGEIQINTSGYKDQIRQFLLRANPKSSTDYLVSENRNAFIPATSVLYVNDDRFKEIKEKYIKSDEY